MATRIAEALGGVHAVLPLAQIAVIDRGRKDYGNLDDLALSLKELGQLQNLVVCEQPDGSPKPFKLLAGGRRLKVMTEILQWPEANCLVFSRELDELELVEIEYDENARRKSLSWKEDADFKAKIQALREQKFGKKVGRDSDGGASLRDTARELGISPATMSIDVKLSEMSDAHPQLFEGCKTKADAYKMMKLAQETLIRTELAKRMLAKAKVEPESKLKHLLERYIVTDFFEGVKALPDRSFQFVEIDPPYAIALHDVKQADGVDTKHSRKTYNEVAAKDYLNFIDQTLAECYRVMSEHSFLILWHAPDPWFELLYMLLEKNNFSSTRITGRWIKPIGQTNQPARYLANACEDFFYAWKGAPSLAKSGRTNVFPFAPVPASKKIHPTERPLELITEILATFAWEGSRVLIPFLGSGKTLLAAELLGMMGVGFELAPEYKEAFIVLASEHIK